MALFLRVLKGAALIALLAMASCSAGKDTGNGNAEPSPTAAAEPEAAPKANYNSTPKVPNLQSELLDDRYKTTSTPLGQFDFKNFTYPLPRGWQNPDGSDDMALVNGRVAPVETSVNDKMDDEEKADAKAQRRIGMSYVTTKYFDVTGDGQDEALVILKIETGGSAIPQVIYVFEWKGDKPELIWQFRTGDRADGGLKNIYPENDELIVELYGQDRFLLGQNETGKITGDFEQLCCPTYFTRTTYKWNGKSFLMGKERLTYSVNDPSAPPIDKLGEKVNNPPKSGKK